jgi:two-component system, NarL family, nitrate/nitrite response regulator NarL
MASTTTEPPVRPLTDREIDVLQRVARGDSSRRIAADLGLIRSTVRDAYENAQRKLNLAREARRTLVLVGFGR